MVPRYFFIAPTLLGTIIGLLLATLVALRAEVMDGQRMFRAVADMAQEFIYVRRVDGSYDYVSPSCEQLTGYPAEDFYAQPSFMNSLVHAEDRAVWDRHVHQMDHHGIPEKLVIRIQTRSGELRWIEHLCTDVRDAQGNILGVRSANLDITERIEHEQAQSVAAVAFETHEAILITDRHSRILRVNRAFSDITGYTADEVIGQTPTLLRSGLQDEAFYTEMWATLNTLGRWSGELFDRRKNGEIYPKHLTITAVPDKSGEVAYYVGTFSDITERKEAEEKINRLAYYDPVTNLPNRRLLLDRLAQATAASQRHGRHGAVLFIDIDNFKNLNDTRGHDEGDQLLVEVAESLMACVRAEDTVARLGGDEFVVLLEDLGKVGPAAASLVEATAEKILRAINRLLPVEGKAVLLHLQHWCDDVQGPGRKHRRTAQARRRCAVPRQGCGAGAAYDSLIRPCRPRRMPGRTWRPICGKRSRHQHFALHYQAQVDFAGNILGAEALIRWKHHERGDISPTEFIPFAEECGLIIPIGRWVLQAACAQIKAWEDHPVASQLQLAVNVSARQFMQADFVEDVILQLQASGADPGRLKFELTESALIDGIDEVIDKMRLLKAVGIHFSLDDFGTGYSSLSYLRRLPLDQLKIDRSFVTDITTNNSDAVIAQTIIGMARNLRLDVIAEGVETKEQLELLERQGCLGFQGFLFSRPVPLDEFEQLMSRPKQPIY